MVTGSLAQPQIVLTTKTLSVQWVQHGTGEVDTGVSTPIYNSKIRGALKDSHLQADLEHETTSGASCGKQWASRHVFLW